MTQHTRTSFTRAADVLEHAAEYLARIVELLDELQDDELPERVRLLLAAFATEQRSLRGAVERYVDDAPRKVLEAFVTFSVEVPAIAAASERPLTTLGLTQWLLGCNGHLIAVFQALTDTAATAEVRAAFAALAGQMQSHDRKLSKEYQRFEDL